MGTTGDDGYKNVKDFEGGRRRGGGGGGGGVHPPLFPSREKISTPNPRGGVESRGVLKDSREGENDSINKWLLLICNVADETAIAASGRTRSCSSKQSLLCNVSARFPAAITTVNLSLNSWSVSAWGREQLSWSCLPVSADSELLLTS
jgi:hypothetical protein